MTYYGQEGWFASPSGSSTGLGTIDDPASLARLQLIVPVGDTINLRGSSSIADALANPYEWPESFTIEHVYKPYQREIVLIEGIGAPDSYALDYPINLIKNAVYSPSGQLDSGDGLLLFRTRVDASTNRHTLIRGHYPGLWSFGLNGGDRTLAQAAFKNVILMDTMSISGGLAAGVGADGLIVIDPGYWYDDDGNGFPGVGGGETWYWHNDDPDSNWTYAYRLISINSIANPYQIYSASGKDANKLLIEQAVICGVYNPDLPGLGLQNDLYAQNTGSLADVLIRQMNMYVGLSGLGNGYHLNTTGEISDSYLVLYRSIKATRWDGLSFLRNTVIGTNPSEFLLHVDNALELTGMLNIDYNIYHSAKVKPLRIKDTIDHDVDLAGMQALGYDLNSTLSASPPTSNIVTVIGFTGSRINGIVIINNWELLSSVEILDAPLTDLGLTAGRNYEARYGQNWLNDAPNGAGNVQPFVYDGTSITLSFSDRSVRLPPGSDKPFSLLPDDYGVWIIIDVDNS